MIKLLTALFVSIFLFSCEEEAAKIPSGFEHISKDGKAHFIYVKPDYLGDKVQQRDAGRTICRDVFKDENYCELYYFSRREEVPTKFPIMGRIRPIGYFEMKGGKEKFKVLSDKDIVNYNR